MSWYSRNRLFGKLLPILLLGTTISLVLLFASSLSTVRLLPGGDLNIFAILLGRMEWPSMASPTSESYSAETTSLGWMRAAFWIVLALVLIYAFVSPRYRRLLFRTLFLTILLVIVLERLQQVWQSGEEEETEGLGLGQLPEAQPSVELPPPPEFVSSTPDWATWSIAVLVALTIVLVVWFFAKRLRRKPEDDIQGAVIREAQTALVDLDAGGDLREVILRCYAQMSRTMAADRNVYRHQAMTPRDFEQHLAERGFSDEHIGRLTRLFETVRYSPGEPGPESEAEARACLTAIIDEYGSNARKASMAKVQTAEAAL